MQIEWTIAQIERQTETGGVITAHWRVSAEDDGFTAGSYGSAGFTPDPESEDFIPFEELTETNILEWLWAQEGFDKDEIEAGLVTQIEAQKNPSTVSGLPWS
jgi:hypothetical protein